MAPLMLIAMAVAGGVGAVARFVLDSEIRARTQGTLPWGTIAINLSGSFLLGLLTGLVTSRIAPESWQLVVGTGFLGGYTTFSTASYETVRLLQERKTLIGAINALGTLIGATLAAGLGLWAGMLL